MSTALDRLDMLLDSLTEAAPPWVRTAAQQDNFRGPNGSMVVGYEWKRAHGRKIKEGEDPSEVMLVSDWDSAEQCASCGRKIVHVYWVQNAEGVLQPYGGDHLHTALGYPNELKKHALTKIKGAVTNKPM